jgi:hypothetical protein
MSIKFRKNYPLHPTAKFQKPIKENSFDLFENPKGKIENSTFILILEWCVGVSITHHFQYPKAINKKNLVSH